MHCKSACVRLKEIIIIMIIIIKIKFIYLPLKW